MPRKNYHRNEPKRVEMVIDLPSFWVSQIHRWSRIVDQSHHCDPEMLEIRTWVIGHLHVCSYICYHRLLYHLLAMEIHSLALHCSLSSCTVLSSLCSRALCCPRFAHVRCPALAMLTCTVLHLLGSCTVLCLLFFMCCACSFICSRAHEKVLRY